MDDASSPVLGRKTTPTVNTCLNPPKHGENRCRFSGYAILTLIVERSVETIQIEIQ